MHNAMDKAADEGSDQPGQERQPGPDRQLHQHGEQPVAKPQLQRKLLKRKLIISNTYKLRNKSLKSAS